MKKIITYISQQPEKQLVKGKYESTTNEKLECDIEAAFPVTPMINGYAQSGEEIEIIAIIEKDNENCKRNFEVLKEEIQDLSNIKDFKYHFLEIEVTGEEIVREHLLTFEKLLNAVNDDDTLFVCATYGTKPIPIVEMMAVNAAYKIRKGVTVECVAYGRAVRDSDGKIKNMILYDITALFFMTRLVDSIVQNPLEEPETIIRRVLEDDDETA